MAISTTCVNSNTQTSAALCIDDPDFLQGRDILTSGFQIGVGGWKVGAAFQYDDEGQERNNEQIEVVAGVTYGAGPWTVGAQGAYGIDQDGETNSACNNAIHQNLIAGLNPAGTAGAVGNGNNRGCTSDADQVVAGEIGGAYTLGPGVTIGAAVQGWRGWGDDGNENFDGVAVTMGPALSF